MYQIRRHDRVTKPEGVTMKTSVSTEELGVSLTRLKSIYPYAGLKVYKLVEVEVATQTVYTIKEKI